MQHHRHQEFIRFLNAIEADVTAGKSERDPQQLCGPQAPKVTHDPKPGKGLRPDKLAPEVCDRGDARSTVAPPGRLGGLGN
jgi:hypothetical protein